MNRRSMLGLIGLAGAGGAVSLTAAAALTQEPTEGDLLYGHPWDHDAELANSAGLGNGAHQRVGSGRIVWNEEVDERVLALTFDDGPDPDLTPRVLDVLDEAGAAATFMMMGWNAQRHSLLARRVVDAGHEVGNHGWSHLDLAQCTPEQVHNEISKGRGAIEDAIGAPVRWFRPARGVITGGALRVANELDHDIAMWSLTAAIRDGQTAADVEAHLVERATPGDIVCLHDGIGRGTFDGTSDFAAKLRSRRTAETAALGTALEALRAEGFRFVTLTELEQLGHTAA
jgi:peptidoglycan/xylan/chitin deacetylase (PgdA/CDA1 family)